MENTSNFLALMSNLQYRYENSWKEKVTDTDELISNATALSSYKFGIWDKAIKDDNIEGNNISSKRYFAEDNNILFQTQEDNEKLNSKLSVYDMKKNSMKDITDKKDIFSVLDSMDGDNKADTITDKNGREVKKADFLNTEKKYAVKLVHDGFEVVGEEVVPEVPEDELPTTTTGDPHYDLNGKRAFDHQGTIGSEYLELDSDEMKMVSQRGKYSNKNDTTVITDESIELKGTDLTVVAHGNGNYEVNQKDAAGNNNVIMDQNGYKTADAETTLNKSGVTIGKAGKTLSVAFQNRKAVLNLNGSYIDDMTSAQTNDTGLKSQMAAIYDQNTEANQDGKITINGKEYKYNAAQQDMVYEEGHTSFNLDRKVRGTKVSDLIRSDLAKLDTDGTLDGFKTNADGTKTRLSLSQAYSSSSGYSAAEFNELIGDLMYSADSSYF
jgi:hypothetical protein